MREAIDLISLQPLKLKFNAKIQAEESMLMPGAFYLKSGPLYHPSHDPVQGGVLVFYMISHDACEFVSPSD